MFDFHRSRDDHRLLTFIAAACRLGTSGVESGVVVDIATTDTLRLGILITSSYCTSFCILIEETVRELSVSLIITTLPRDL